MDDVLDDTIQNELPAAQGARPWTTGSIQMTEIIKTMSNRVRRSNGVRKSTALERFRRNQLQKMIRMNGDLCQEVGFATAEAMQKPNMVVQEKVVISNNLPGEIEAENNRLLAIEKQIGSWRESVIVIKQAQGSDQLRLNKMRKDQRFVHLMENRLQRSLLKNNAMHAKNEALKREQETMRRERGFSDTIQIGHQAQLEHMMRMICQRANECDVIDDHNKRSNERLQNLRMSSDQWYMSFNSDWGVVSKLMSDHDAKFTRVTSIERATSSRREARSVESSSNQEKNLQKKHSRAEWMLATDRANIAIVQKRLAGFNKAVQLLRGATGTSTIEDLVIAFTEQEERNFSQFNVANDLVKDIEFVTQGNRALEDVAEVSEGNGTAVATIKGQYEKNIHAVQEKIAAFKVMELEAKVELWQMTTKIREIVAMFHSDSSETINNASLKEGLIALEQAVIFVTTYRDANNPFYSQNNDVPFVEEFLEDTIGFDITLPSTLTEEMESGADANRAKKVMASFATAVTNMAVANMPAHIRPMSIDSACQATMESIMVYSQQQEVTNKDAIPPTERSDSSVRFDDADMTAGTSN